jgi:hypothetical protein
MTELTREDFLLLSEAAKDYPPGFGTRWGRDSEVNLTAMHMSDLIRYYLQHPEYG